MRRVADLRGEGVLLSKPYRAGVTLTVSSHPPRVFVALKADENLIVPGLVRRVSSAIEVWDLDGPVDKPVPGIGNLDFSITRLAVDDEGRLLAAATNRGPRAWAFRDGQWKDMPTHVARSANSIAVSPDGTLMAAGVSAAAAVFMLDGDQPSKPTRFEGHGLNVWSLAFSNDGRRLATGDWTATVRVFTLGQPIPLLLTGHRRLAAGNGGRVVNTVDFSRDGKLLVTAVKGGSVLLQDSIGPSPETELEHPEVLSAHFFAGGVATVGRQSVRTWPVSVEQLQALLVGVTAATLTPDERRDLLGETDE